MTINTDLLAAMADALLVAAGPARADAERDPPRKWSQPSYERENFLARPGSVGLPRQCGSIIVH